MREVEKYPSFSKLDTKQAMKPIGSTVVELAQGVILLDSVLPTHRVSGMAHGRGPEG